MSVKKNHKSNIDFGDILSKASSFILSDSGQKFLCGTYSNGKTRSVIDALHDEIISPKDREKWEKKNKKKKMKHNKRKKDKFSKNLWNR